MLEIHNSFIVFMKTLTSTKFVRSELTVETLASSKYGKIILPWPKQKRNMIAFFRWHLWPLNGMKMTCIPRVYCYQFCLEQNGKKWHMEENDFRHCYGKVAFWKLLDHSYVQIVLCQQLQDTLTTAFGKIPCSSIFYGHGSACVLNLSSRLR